MQMHDHVLSFFGFSRLQFGKHLGPAEAGLNVAQALTARELRKRHRTIVLDGNRYRPLYVRRRPLRGRRRNGRRSERMSSKARSS